MSSDGIIFRPLQQGDYEKGFCQLLGQLTVVGNITEQAFNDRLALCHASGLIHTIVGEFVEQKKIVAAATLMVEPKFIRDCSFVGHIEDVVVDKEMRGRKLGERVMKECLRVAQERKCYKVILDCAEHNVGFYEKLGFVKKELQMRYDVPQQQPSKV